jgi:hypothetical protein
MSYLLKALVSARSFSRREQRGLHLLCKHCFRLRTYAVEPLTAADRHLFDVIGDEGRTCQSSGDYKPPTGRVRRTFSARVWETTVPKPGVFPQNRDRFPASLEVLIPRTRSRRCFKVDIRLSCLLADFVRLWHAGSRRASGQCAPAQTGDRS